MIEEYDNNSVILKDCECICDSRKAILVSSDLFDEPLWFPLSQIHDDSEVYKNGTSGNFIFSNWIAKEKELI